jgi:hypothetical protein
VERVLVGKHSGHVGALGVLRGQGSGSDATLSVEAWPPSER